MKILLSVLLLAASTSFGQACADRACDDAAVSAIFAANSITKPADATNLASTGRVTVLNLLDSNIRTIPADIGRLVMLHSLTIRGTKITALPAAIGLVNRVRNVVITDNKLLTSLPTEIGNWGATTTKIVSLDRNGLTSVPGTIGNWTDIETLTMAGNKLTTVPPEIQKLDNGYFHILDLSDNLISSLPVEIGGIANLNYLLLANNRLTEIPAGVFNFTQLWSLDMSNNLVTTIPAAISTRKVLKELDLSGNRLTSIPADISGAIKLEILRLSNNQITTLPSVLWNLTLLTELSLKGNQLTTIPADISKLTALKRLLLSRNQIADLPASITTLTGLYGMEIGYNRLCTVTPAIVTWADRNSIDSILWTNTQTKNGTTSCTGVSTLEQESPSESYRMTKNIREHSVTFFHKEGPSELSVFSTTGKLLTTSTSIKNPVTFNYGPLPKGIYLVQFKSKSETRLQKLVLE